MSKKAHMSWHDIELFLEEKVSKKDLESKKNHYIEELLELKRDCEAYLKEDNDEIYQLEKDIYYERLIKNEQILKSLKLIFPNDKNLTLILEDL